MRRSESKSHIEKRILRKDSALNRKALTDLDLMQKKREEFYDSAILAKYDIDRLDFLASIISFEKLIMSIM